MKKLALSAIAATVLFGTGAFAADMSQRPVYKAAPVAQLFNWSGFYVGGYAGYMNADSRDVTSPGTEIRLSGNVYGGLVGVNWQAGNFVYGLEADGGQSNAKHGSDGNNVDNFHDRFVGNIRARAGIAYDRLLFFVAGGTAFTNEKVSHGGGFGSVTEDRAGWTLGGGVDWAATQNWVLRLEYLYASFGNKTYNFGVDSHVVSYDNQNTVRAAAIYKW